MRKGREARAGCRGMVVGGGVGSGDQTSNDISNVLVSLLCVQSEALPVGGGI